MSICECVNQTIDVDLRVVLDGSSFGQTGITVSCIQHIIQVYLKNNTIRIYLFSEPNVIDKFIIVFIHSWLVSMVTNERESHMLHHDIWLPWTLFAALNS